MKNLLLISLLLVSGVATAAPCDDLTPYGTPSVPGVKTTKICRTAYVVEYFDNCKVPFYSAEHLEEKNIGGNEPRIQFHEDTSLPVQLRAENKDYVKAGYDKGHMAPAADFHENHVEMGESFNLSNALPQTPQLNRGPWRLIEIRTRAFAVKYSDVYVITGGIFNDHPKVIGNNVCVPIATYKVVIDKKTNESIGFIAANVTNVSKRPEDYQVPVAAVEKVTGINFTPELDKATADAMKDTIGANFQVKK